MLKNFWDAVEFSSAVSETPVQVTVMSEQYGPFWMESVMMLIALGVIVLGLRKNEAQACQ